MSEAAPPTAAAPPSAGDAPGPHTTTFDDPSPTPAPTLRVAVTSVLSYALAHNRIAVVHRIDIANPGPPVRAATLRLLVEDATGPIGAATDMLVDLPEAGSTRLTQPQLWLDPAAMARIEEQRPGGVRAGLLIDGRLVVESIEPVRILAANQWLAAPELLGLEMLAAFVMPNHPSIGSLLAEAAELLAERTGSPSMPGYQAGPNRVDQVVRAIYEAAQARRIRYVTAPASWTDVGQKVRTPGEVLEDRLGTCLDTTLMLAAALEQAGLRPLVFVVHGHAFLGYWRDEHALAGPAQTEAADIVNLIDLDLIRLVETTTITVSDPPWSFDASHRPPYITFLSGDLSAVHGVVDVQQCRLDRILPLPAQVRGADGSVQVFSYLPPDRRTELGQPSAHSAGQATADPAASTPPASSSGRTRSST